MRVRDTPGLGGASLPFVASSSHTPAPYPSSAPSAPKERTPHHTTLSPACAQQNKERGAHLAKRAAADDLDGAEVGEADLGAAEAEELRLDLGVLARLALAALVGERGRALVELRAAVRACRCARAGGDGTRAVGEAVA